MGGILQRARLASVFHLNVAATVGKGIIDPAFVDNRLIFGALIGAISWNLITWYYGIPSSSSHALIGGMIGAAVVEGRHGAAARAGHHQDRDLHRDLAGAGHVAGLGHHVGACRGFFSARRRGAWTAGSGGCSSFRPRIFSIGHGGNDAQKTMGIIWLLLIAAGVTHQGPPAATGWSSSCFVAIGLGTLFGGWRIVKTMGQRITKLKPVGGFAAETGGAISLFLATILGIPVSTTHTITGAIIGVGAAQRASAVRWGVAGNIVIAWIVTIPASAAIAAIAWWIGGLFF